MIPIEFRHFHLFCGLGGGARGFNRGRAALGSLHAIGRCIGGIDSDPISIRNFQRLAGVPGTVMDLFDRAQYAAFHGREPPAGWREATPQDIQRAAGGERPHIVFLSAPCKGFSGLLSETKSGTDKYQALNRLTLRGVWLMLEAWADDPPELILFENVPRIAARGRHFLTRIGELLRQYGYAVRETTHDCGEIGELAQSRKRFLMVARQVEKVPAFLYEPPKRALRPVRDVLERLPMPGDSAGGPMHRVPALQWKTWVRLAFVEAGSDWRSLNKLRVRDGVLADYLITPEYHSGMLGVNRWDGPTGTVTSTARPNNGNFAVADPRHASGAPQFGQYGVRRWNDSTGAVIGVKSPGQGGFAVADPRQSGLPFAKYAVTRWDNPGGTVIGGSTTGQGAFAVADPRHAGPAKHSNESAVTPWDRPARAVTSAHGTGACVADPRPPAGKLFGKYAVTRFDQSAGAVIGGDDSGAYAVADPRPDMQRGQGDHYLTGGHYGVVPWESASGAVSGAACHDNGRWSVADPRMPEASERLTCVIRALDGTWHRPFTTLELAALQSLFDPDDLAGFSLDGTSDQAWREGIGNAVPSDAGAAIASCMYRTLLAARTGEAFALSAEPVWVRPVAIALAVGGAP